MSKKNRIRGAVLGLAAVAALAATSAAQAHMPGGTVTIRHQDRGCHAWSFAGGSFHANLSVTIKAGSALKFVNNDVMPHKLVQKAGPKLHLVRANMNHMSASTVVKFLKKGTYRFTTKAGEDYPMMGEMHTIGDDYILRLTVNVT